MLQIHGFPPDIQKWIIGQQMACDDMTLAQCGVNTSGASLFLYLVSAQSVGLTQESFKAKYGHLVKPGKLANVLRKCFIESSLYYHSMKIFLLLYMYMQLIHLQAFLGYPDLCLKQVTLAMKVNFTIFIKYIPNYPLLPSKSINMNMMTCRSFGRLQYYRSSYNACRCKRR